MLIAKKLFAKLFISERYFTIGIRKRQEKSILTGRCFIPQYVMTADRQKWYADPILVEDEGKTWLFYEAVLGDHGHIEVAQVLNNCTLGEPTVVLQGDCHYSYPFVFRHENTWYMIPESSAASEVRLYRAKSFPDTWEMCTVLLRERAVDTTVFEQDNQLYVLTYVPEFKTERVSPRAYRLILNGEKSELLPIAWDVYDELRVRGAGPVFKDNQKLYRPAQISREQCYGDGLAFYQINSTPEGYCEEPICKIDAEKLKVCGCYADGLHTYCRSARFEAIDIRSGTVDFGKPFKKLLGK